MADLDPVRRSCLAGDTGRLSARPRRADRPPRSGRGRPRHSSRSALRARTRSRGCGACAGSTRCRRSGCAQRSASGGASIIPTSSPPISGSFPASTPPASSAGSGRSPRPARPTPGGCWSRPPTTTAAARSSVEALERRQRGHAPEIINISWKAQRRLNARWRQLKDARRKPGGIVAVAIARELAAYCWEIATCPTTAPNRHPHQLPARDSPTHANPQTTRCGWRGGPSHPGSRTQLRDSSPEHPPPAGALDFRQRTCDEQRSWGTQPPNMSMTNRREPRERPGRPANRNHTTTSTTSHTMAINPCPLMS